MTQGVRGSSARKDAAALSKPKAQVNKLSAEAAGTGELSAFAGAEAGASVSGALQWQRAEMLEFKNFAKIDAKAQGQAGIGGTAMFDIGYSGGKFRIKLKLAACVGLGLKGEIAAEVGVTEIAEFDLWFKHQVVNAMDQNLKYFGEEAWKAYVYMKALAIAEGRKLAEYLGKSAAELMGSWEELLETASREVLNRIQASADYILTSVAEGKALLLGLLERMKIDFKELQSEIEHLSLWLLSGTQTTLEAENIYARVGTVLRAPMNSQAGRMRLVSLVGSEAALSRLEQTLKSEPTPGYSLAFCTDPSYQFERNGGTHMAWQRSGFGSNNNRLA